MDIFFAKLFGLYFIVIGLLILWRRDALMPAVTRFSQDTGLLLIFSCLEIAAGLALVVAYPAVSLSIPGAISLVGYMLVVEGVIYLAAPARFIRSFIALFNKPVWFVVGGILSVFAGIYLTGKGFGYF